MRLLDSLIDGFVLNPRYFVYVHVHVINVHLYVMAGRTNNLLSMHRETEVFRFFVYSFIGGVY